MSVVKKNGHGTTSTLAGADSQTVISAAVKFPPAPTQNGGVPGK